MRHMARGDMGRSTITMRRLIVKKNVCFKSSQKLGLVHSAEKQGLVQPNIPFAQCPNHPLMGWCAPRCDQGRTNGAFTVRKLLLQPVHGGQESLKGPPARD